jgi:hypothetical protein
MNPACYRLAVPDDFRRPLAAAWLLLAAAALLVSGLFVILIVFSRTPGLQALFPFEGFFHLAIVAHVDFSVLIWFAAIGAMLWTLAAHPRARAVAWTAFGLVTLGSLLMAWGPFQPGQAIMSNYVPVLDNTPFLAGLAVFAAGIVLMALRGLLFALPVGSAMSPGGVLRFGIHTSVLCMLLAAVALVWSLVSLPDWMQGKPFFETLFWGSGHVLQFAWTQLMLVAWLWLAGVTAWRLPLSPRLVTLLLLAGALPAFLTIWAYLAFDVGSPQHRTFFIWMMAAGGGLAAGPIALALLAGWWQSARAADTSSRGLRAALAFSILLFGIGGVLGFMIDDSNTMVPAHYHGCIVAVTLAFMGVALHLLPELGFARPSPKLVLAMPWVYGVGQILHVAGLAFAGGHGVQRKTAGAAQGLEGIAQLASMAVMGIGGLVAIIGGILFLVAVAGSIRRRRKAAQSHPASEGAAADA